MAKTIGELERGDRIYVLNEGRMSFTELIVTNIHLGGIIRIGVEFPDKEVNSFSTCYHIKPIFRNKTTTLSISTHNSQCAISEILNNQTAYKIRRANIHYRHKWLR
jgi:hypothetical protein